MVLLSVHLRFRKLRVPRNMDRGVPNAARNPAHCHGSIANKGERPQSIQHSRVQISHVSAFETRTFKVQMHRENMVPIESGIQLAKVKQGSCKQRRHAQQQERQADLSGQKHAGPSTSLVTDDSAIAHIRLNGNAEVSACDLPRGQSTEPNQSNQQQRCADQKILYAKMKIERQSMLSCGSPVKQNRAHQAAGG